MLGLLLVRAKRASERQRTHTHKYTQTCARHSRTYARYTRDVCVCVCAHAHMCDVRICMHGAYERDCWSALLCARCVRLCIEPIGRLLCGEGGANMTKRAHATQRQCHNAKMQ